MIHSTKVEEFPSLTEIPVFFFSSPSTLTMVVCFNQTNQVSYIYMTGILNTVVHIFFKKKKKDTPRYIYLSFRKIVKVELLFDQTFVHKQIRERRDVSLC